MRPPSKAFVNSSAVRPYIFCSSSCRRIPRSKSCRFSSPCSLPFAWICPKAVAMPPKSAPVAPATSASRLVVSTIFSVSNPNALRRLPVSISSWLVNGVTAPISRSAPMMFFASLREPVSTSRLLVCFSSSPNCVNENLTVPIAAAAAAAAIAAFPNLPVLAAASLAFLAMLLRESVALFFSWLNFLVVRSTAPFSFSIACSAFLLDAATARRGLTAFAASTISRTVESAATPAPHAVP